MARVVRHFIEEARPCAYLHDRLASLEMPVLVLVGEQDRPFVGSSERMAKAIPGARLVVIPDAGHSPQVENPEAWWAALTAFLEEVG